MKNILKLLLLIIWLGGGSDVNAQKIKELYVSYPQSDGTLYHFFPVTFFQHKADGDLIFDMTYQSGRDSAVINFTYYASQPQLLDSVRFVAGTVLLSGKAEKFFIEAETAKKWIHRYSLKVPITYLFAFFNPEEQPYVNLYFESVTKDYELKKTEWSKKSVSYQTIIKTIRIESEK